MKNGLKIVPSKGDAFPYETHPDMIKVHTCLVAVAKRGGSKTTSLVNLMEKLPFNKIFILSPTYNSNLDLMKRLNVEPGDIYEDPNDISCLQKIHDSINKERDDLEKYQEDLKRWSKFQSMLSNPLVRMPDDLLLDFYKDGQFQAPTHKYGGKKPCMCILIDDCLNSNIFIGKGLKKLNSLVIYMRHLGQLKDGGALGCSFFIAVQSYKCGTGQGGLSKTIRNQMTHMILMKTKNLNELAEIADEVAGEVDKDTFMKVYENAIQKPFDFLFIDLHKKDHHPSMFRQNFDRFIIPSEIKK
jgi:hypothetical protein